MKKASQSIRTPMDGLAAYGIAAGELERIDSIIVQHGSCLLKEAELKELFEDDYFHSRQFVLMASLTRERHWSFEFQLGTGEVRIASLARAA